MTSVRTQNNNTFINELSRLVGHSHLLTDPEKTARYRKGFRSGQGEALAVVFPGTLLELWRVLSACVNADKIILMQAANTGLTEGSTPNGNDYDRDIVIISTLRLDKLHLLDKGEQVLAYPGTTLYSLEKALKPLGREPHSVIGSSCIGASVIGGICNNSGGSLVQRGPAYTEMSLFARIDENGKLQLVNHLGINLGVTPEQILSKLDDERVNDADVQHDGRHAHDHDYVERVRDIEADTPARYNADPDRLFESSGCAGKLAVFAVRLDTFPAQKNQQVFYIGTNQPEVLTEIRRHILGEFTNLPVAGEYMHRDIYDIAERYGKDTFLMIDKLGTDKMPFFFTMKGRADAMLGKVSLFKPHFTDRFMQKLGTAFPAHLPPRMKSWRDKYEHHLLLKMSGDGIAEAQTWLAEYFKTAEGDFFACTPEEGNKAFLHRFAAAGAAIRYQAVHADEVEDILALDIALRRNDTEWFEHLPPEIDSKLVHKLYYGHFMCHVFHQDYIVKKGVDAHALKEQMLELLRARGAQYPAEHNVGHLYEAPETLKRFYRENDPTNSMNPGIGKTTKHKYWKEAVQTERDETQPSDQTL
ncbi:MULTISPECIES: D-lactate dehydrogenase [Lelliottia]|jgi:D-lactate dehydrogenase|uniref:Quinone-dependent D-lactate dehydrogenase n=1 Tax=Lelliottia nimipressuralis TaxID=69220 RepID=A0ABY3P0M3_9ENTR|nr:MULTISPECIES: D-lactate dehydrogenase [Lelliottia]MDH6631979.1 D-lactate dehydrogenase [Lelliottia amnigena]PKA31310.1 D-lactate dehydrogenase [Cedecea lapagei]AVY98405.1 D-lactate dehydrogenase [Lelliottia sp. WB101]MCD4561917.1 D-lactate dehydrogenase [Lelliottia nimipressuralis]RXJ11666.1 D-lactate dehydrogenase [Lelliottia nimipressuralis]